MSKTALVFTGAAARISQEAALTYALDRHWSDEKWWSREEWEDNTDLKHDIAAVSGASSGALNALALNAIYNVHTPYDWKNYISFLTEKLENSMVYAKNTKGIIPVYLTDALRKTIADEIEAMGFTEDANSMALTALPLISFISVTHIGIDNPGKVFRLSNRDIYHRHDNKLRLLDCLMASSAIPAVFPSRGISNADGHIPEHPPQIEKNVYIDGGLLDDFAPFQAILDWCPVPDKFKAEKMIIVSPMWAEKESLPEIGDLRGQPAESIGMEKWLWLILNKLFTGWIGHSGMAVFMERIRAIPEAWKKSTYVYLPALKEEYPLLDFSHTVQQKQFDESFNWAESNHPVPLLEFLEESGAFLPEKRQTVPEDPVFADK